MESTDAFLAANKNETGYKSEPYRWVILVACMLSILNNAVSVSTLSPVAIQVQETYELSSLTYVNLCAISFSLCSVPFTIVAVWAFKHYSLTKVLRLASVV